MQGLHGAHLAIDVEAFSLIQKGLDINLNLRA